MIPPLRVRSDAVASSVRVLEPVRLKELASARRPLLEAAKVASPAARTIAVPRAVSEFETVRRPPLSWTAPVRVLATARVRLPVLDFCSVPAPERAPSKVTSADWFTSRLEAMAKAVFAKAAALAVMATVPVLPELPMVTAPVPVTVLPFKERVAPGTAAKVAAPVRTIGRVAARLKLALATRAPPLKVRPPVEAPRLASSPTRRLPPLRKVPPA